MLRVRHTFGLFLLMAGAAVLIVAFVMSSQSFRDCKANAKPSQESQQNETNQAIPQGNTNLLVVPSTWDCVGKVVVDDHDGIIAIATALLTFVTAGLLYVGYIQIQTSRAQLRAYVFIEA